MKTLVYSLLLCASFLFYSTSSYSLGSEPQLTQSEKSIGIESGTPEKRQIKQKKVLIAPLLTPLLSDTAPESNQLHKQIIAKILTISSDLSRFKLFQISDIDSENNEIKITQNWLLLKSRKAEIDEILLIKNISFSQFGVRPDDSNDHNEKPHNLGFWWAVLSFFSSTSSLDEVEPEYPNNIQSQINIHLEKINALTGESIESAELKEVFTGGNRHYSKQKLMILLDGELTKKIAKLYPVIALSHLINKHFITLKKGTNDGVKIGAIFDIVIPDEKHSEKIARKAVNQEPTATTGIIFDGLCSDTSCDEVDAAALFDNKSANTESRFALARVVSVSKEASRLQIMRQWKSHDDTFKAIENLQNLYSINLLASANVDNAAIKLGAEAIFNPFSRISYGAGIKYLSVSDSRNKNISSMSLDFIALVDLFRFREYSFTLQSGINANLLFRSDDENKSVTGLIAGLPVFLNAERKINQKWSSFISLGYLFSPQTSDWQYTKNKKDRNGEDVSKTSPAYWNGTAPVVDVSGVYFRLGMKAYFF